MKPLRTKLKLEGFPEKIEYQHSIFGMGSCFAVHMAEQLSTHKFKTALNPFGILYNPFSISQSIQRLIDGNRAISRRSCSSTTGSGTVMIITEYFQHLNGSLVWKK
jgi:hypothetical protein